MLTEIKNLQLATLVAELEGLLAQPILAPTKPDYDAVMRVKDSLKEFQSDTLLPDDETERQRAVMLAYVRLQTFEAFWEKNGNKWAPRPIGQLLALGGKAKIDEALAAYPNSFAQKELPAACKALRAHTIGKLAGHSRSEIAGPQSQNCGNETLAWIDFVCKRFGLSEPQHKQSAA